MTSTLPVQPDSTDSSEIESTENHGHAAEEHGDFRMFGLATFLVADAMTFAGFFAAYLTFKAVNPLPSGAIYELELPLPTLQVAPWNVERHMFAAEHADAKCNAGRHELLVHHGGLDYHILQRHVRMLIDHKVTAHLAVRSFAHF